MILSGVAECRRPLRTTVAEGAPRLECDLAGGGEIALARVKPSQSPSGRLGERVTVRVQEPSLRIETSVSRPHLAASRLSAFERRRVKADESRQSSPLIGNKDP